MALRKKGGDQNRDERGAGSDDAINNLPARKVPPWCQPGANYDPDRLCCPHCGCPGSTVTKTKHLPGFIRRYRVCLHCDRSFRTREVSDDSNRKRKA